MTEGAIEGRNGGRMKKPAFQFYPGDWRKDPGVQSLDYHDRGVWFEILCLMHESEERGALILNGMPMPDEALARLLGLDNQTLNQTVTTLLAYGVASRRQEDGALICRRMVRDEKLSETRREAGKKGGNPSLLNQNSKQTETTQLNQKSTPSSSSSSSDKPPSPSLRSGASPGEGKAQSPKQGTRIPDDFEVTPDLMAWAAEKHPDVNLTMETEKFVDFWRAKPGAAGRKLDWPATWRNWIRRAAERLPAGGPNAPRPRPLSAVERVREANRRAEEAERSGLRVVAGQRID